MRGYKHCPHAASPRGDGYFLPSSFRSRSDALHSIHMKTIYSPLASARIVINNFSFLSHTIESILRFVQPVACAPAIAAAITSALANVAETVAAAHRGIDGSRCRDVRHVCRPRRPQHCRWHYRCTVTAGWDGSSRVNNYISLVRTQE